MRQYTLLKHTQIARSLPYLHSTVDVGILLPLSDFSAWTRTTSWPPYKYQLESTSDPLLLNRHYLKLVAESKDVDTIAESGRELLLEISESIHELIYLIQIELKK